MLRGAQEAERLKSDKAWLVDMPTREFASNFPKKLSPFIELMDKPPGLVSFEATMGPDAKEYCTRCWNRGLLVLLLSLTLLTDGGQGHSVKQP